MRRKGLSVLLMICVLLGVGFSGVKADDIQKTYQIKFMEKLGITEQIDKSSYNANVSREDFAYYIANANGFDTNYTPSDRKYIDVPTDSYAFSHIDALYTHGVISKSSDGKFRPKDSITYGEAYTMILNSLGYKGLAMAYAEWPKGYLKIASMLDIDKGGVYENISYTEAMELVYDALQCEIYGISGMSDDSIVYGDNADTLLSNAFSLDYGEGTVESLHGGSLYTDNVMEYKRIIISGKQYSVSEDFDESEFLGNYVKYFYDDDSNTIVYMSNEKQKLADYTVSLDLYSEYDGKQMLVFRDNTADKPKTISLEDEHILVYNGMPLSNKIEETMKNLSSGKGTITFKDSDNDNKYNVVIIENYRNFYLNAIDLQNYKLYNKLKVNDLINLKDKEYFEIVLDKEKIKIEDIPDNSVLSVAESINGDMVKIIVSDNYVDGTLTATGKDMVKVDGVSYPVEKSYIEIFKSETAVGEKYRYYLDNFGNISYIGPSVERKMIYGYLVRAIQSSEAFDDSVVFKIFTENNEMITVNGADRVVIDGDAYKNPTVIKSYFDDTYKKGETKPQLIEFELNSSGKIKNIDTALVQNSYEDEDYSLYPAYDATQKHWYQSGRFGLKALFGSSTITFYVPENTDADDKYYYIAPYSQHFVYNEASTSAEIYYRSKNSGYVDVMIAKSNSTKKKDEAEPIIMLDEISEVITEDGDILLQLGGYYNGGYQTAVVEAENCVSGMEKGDIVAVYKNKAGEVISAEIVYDHSAGEIPSNFIDNGKGSLLYKQGETYGTETYYRTPTQLSFGFALAKLNGGVVSWSPIKGGEETERAAVGSLKLTIYDKETDTIYTGDYSEILDFQHEKNNPSRLFFHTYLGVTRSMFVYK